MIFFTNNIVLDSDGVSNKIRLQSEALNKSFSEFNHIYVNDEYDAISSKSGRLSSLSSSKSIRYLQLRIWFFRSLSSIKDDPDKLIYIRYTRYGTPFFLYFLYRLKKLGFKVLLEIPTFPYDSEHSSVSFVKRVFNRAEKATRNFFKYYVDSIVTFSQDSKIFDIECINISNCADAKLPVSNNKIEVGDTINLMCVSSLVEWHGYDRLISSLFEYNKNESTNKYIINVHIIGNGELKRKLENQVLSLGLSNYVFFHGALSSDYLDTVMKIGHIGFDSLGRHRSGVYENNSLKSKEYLMRGLPIVKSHVDSSIDNLGVHVQVSSDEKIFDLNLVISQIMEMDKSPRQIRQLALDNFTWDRQFSTIWNTVYEK